MHKYEDLEKKWFTYKLKRLFVFYIAPALTVLVGIIAYFYFLQTVGGAKQDRATAQVKITVQPQAEALPEPIAEKITEEQNTTIASKPDQNETVEQKEATEQKAPESLKGKECFRVNVEILNIRSEPTTASNVLGKYNYGDIFCAIEKAGDWVLSDKGWVFGKNFIEPVKEPSPIDAPRQEIIPRLEINMTPAEPRKPVVNISSNEIKPIQKVEMLKKEFNQNPTYQSALMVAETYYELNDYQNSRDWALIANEQDSTQPKSWIIFANSLVKLGKKDEAITVLTSYLNKNNSPEVSAALNNIRGR